VWLNPWLLFYYQFTAKSLGKRIFKIGRHLSKLWVRKLITSMRRALEHCPVEKQRTHLNSWNLTDGGQAGTDEGTSCYDNRPRSLMLSVWSTSIKVECQPLVTLTSWLMPPVTVWMLIVCEPSRRFFLVVGDSVRF